MARLIGMRDKFDVAFANDTDADRHGIVTRSGGLMNPNHYLAAGDRLSVRASAAMARGQRGRQDDGLQRDHRPRRHKLGRRLVEVPVGFKWFVDGLVDGSLGFGGEESAGASFLRRDGTVWTTDKDGLILGLLAAEMTARTRADPSQIYDELTEELGVPFYERIDAPATPAQKDLLKKLSPEQIAMTELAGEPVRATLTHGARQRPGVRRRQGRRPTTAGSRRGRRAPRTSTRSMPRVSAARSSEADPGRGAVRHHPGLRGGRLSEGANGPVPAM